MAQRRPVSFLVFAIINFLVAVFFIVCGVCANISDSKTWFVDINGVRWDEKKLNAQLKEKVPAYTPVKITGIVTGYLLCLGLILSGVAMLFGGMLAKIAALLVYVLGVLHHIAMILLHLIFVNPAINQFFDTMPNAIIVGGGAREATRWSTLLPTYLSIAAWIFGILFYIVAALVVGLSSTAGAGKEDKKKKSKQRDDDDVDDEQQEEEEEERPKKKRPRASRDDDDDDRSTGGRRSRR